MTDPVRIPLFTPAGNRELDVDKDARLVNCWVEKDSAGRVWVQKRPALVKVSDVAVAPGRGIFYWDGYLFSIFGNKIYQDGLDVGTVLFAPVSAPQIYGFTATLGAPHKLFFQNTRQAYVFDTGAGLQSIVDLDFPLNMAGAFTLAAGAAYLNGVVYVAWGRGISGPDNATIYGSDLNDPLAWSADNFIQVQIEHDDNVFIAKHLSYLIVGKQWTTEVFHDAGNPTGSPLASDPGLKMNFGCLAAFSVQDIGGDLMWLSTTREGSASVVLLSNLRAQIVSTPAIERLIEAEGIDAISATSWSARVSGHRLYGLRMGSRCLVYDLTMGLWYEWTAADGTPFPIISSSFSRPSFRTMLQHATDGGIYTLELDTYRDEDGVFPVDIYTPNWDGNTRVKKVISRLELVGDQVPNDLCFVAVSDDDYQTWSEYREVDRGVERQLLFNCGTFRRRAWHVHHQSNNPFRVQALEVQVLLGSI